MRSSSGSREAAWLLLSWRVGPLADREGGFADRDGSQPGQGRGRAGVDGSGTPKPQAHTRRHAKASNVLARHDYRPDHPPPITPTTAKHQRLKMKQLPRPRCSSPRLLHHPSEQTTFVSATAEPTPNHTRRASSSQGGAPVKSLGGGIYWGPNFLRGGCLDGSAAAATAKRHFEGGDSERGFARERCAAIEAVGGAVGRIA